VLQSYAIPVADFVRAEPRFDGSRVTAVRWAFDRNPQGTVILDDVGFSRMDRGFISPR
jgi:hypothetical protein